MANWPFFHLMNSISCLSKIMMVAFNLQDYSKES